MKENTRGYIGDLMLLSVAIIWGFGFVAVKIGLNNGMGPFYLMFLRFTIASLVILPFQFKKIKKLSIRTIKSGSLLGLFLFLGFAFQTLGLMYTTTSKNAFLTGVNVVIVPFLAWAITKKRLDYYSTFAAFLCLIGIGFLTLNGELSINIGDILTIICAVLFAGHITVTSIVSKNEDSGTLVWIQMTIGAICSIIFAIIFNDQFVVNVPSSMAILYLGLFSTLLAFLLQTLGQKYAHATKAAILLSTESLFGAVLAVIFFKDTLSFQMVIGCVLIFIAIILSETKLSFLTPLLKLNRNNEYE